MAPPISFLWRTKRTTVRTGARNIGSSKISRLLYHRSSELTTWTNSQTTTPAGRKTAQESSRETRGSILRGLSGFWPSRRVYRRFSGKKTNSSYNAPSNVSYSYSWHFYIFLPRDVSVGLLARVGRACRTQYDGHGIALHCMISLRHDNACATLSRCRSFVTTRAFICLQWTKYEHRHCLRWMPTGVKTTEHTPNAHTQLEKTRITDLYVSDW